MNHNIAMLLAGTAMGACALSGVAYAQQPATAGQSTLEEVVVTANRQVDTVHTIPLTVTAVTGRDLERQGLASAADLSAIVPGLRISSANSAARGATGVGGSAAANAQVAIRGISSTVSGAAATSGIYIDDIPLQLRSPIGPTGGGTALPTLFDLDRIEVLKGPQGTLYGGSSEGGTVRFLTQQPSLTKQSLYVRAEGSTIEGGDPNYQFGLSASGPIIQDRIGGHLSVMVQHDGGYLDHVSQFSGHILPGGQDTNSASHEALHASVLFKLTDRASATVGFIYQNEKYRDTDNFWGNIPQYQANVGVPANALPGPPISRGSTLYTYGPFNVFGPFRTGSNTNLGQNFYTSDSQLSPVLTPHSQIMSLPSLTLDYAFNNVSLKSVTAFTETQNKSFVNTSFTDVTGRGSNTSAPVVAATVEGPYNALPANSPFIANVPVYGSFFKSSSLVDSISEEFRASSTNPASHLSWVAGVFYDYTKMRAVGNIQANINDLTAGVLYGTSQTTAPTTAFIAPSSLGEAQYAGFAEGTYTFADKIKLTIGLRATEDDLTYLELTGGSLFGFPPGLVVVGAQGTVKSSAVTPKFGLQYILDSNTNFYANIAEGFRPGGVNPQLSPVCISAATLAGYTSGAPATFNSDSLWSYEGGAKVRAFGGRATVNASVFYIDWSKVQTTIDLGCGGTFAINASTEVSQGVDFEGSALLFPGFTATLRGGYTDAHYTGGVKSPAGTATLINAGDVVPYTPKWQADVGAEYRFSAMEHTAYIRGDMSFQGAVVLNYGSGTVSYLPDNHTLPSATSFNARAGMNIKKFELSAFVDNLTDSRDLLSRQGFATGPGRYGCQNATCSVYSKYSEGSVESTFRPRTIGLALSYRY